MNGVGLGCIVLRCSRHRDYGERGATTGASSLHSWLKCMDISHPMGRRAARTGQSDKCVQGYGGIHSMPLSYSTTHMGGNVSA